MAEHLGATRNGFADMHLVSAEERLSFDGESRLAESSADVQISENFEVCSSVLLRFRPCSQLFAICRTESLAILRHHKSDPDKQRCIPSFIPTQDQYIG